MAMLKIDSALCQHDGICEQTCPLRLIQQEAKRIPKAINNAEEFCINCGHCVAACPSGALSLGSMSADKCPPIDSSSIPAPDMVTHLLRCRRSIRVYNNEAVDREILQQLIDTAAYAPSGHNLFIASVQPINWLIIYDRDEVRRFSAMVIDWMKDSVQQEEHNQRASIMKHLINQYDSGVEIILRNAPHLVIAYAESNEEPDEDTVAASAISLTYLELAAFSLGLGTCWAGYFVRAANSWTPLQKALDLPEGCLVFGAMMLGYPKYKYYRLPLRKEPSITWSL